MRGTGMAHLSDTNAGGVMTRSEELGRRIFCSTRLDDLGAARAEAATGGWVCGAGQVARQDDALAGPLDVGIGDRHGGEERPAITMGGGIENSLPARLLDDAAQIHHGNPVADVTDDRA